MKKKPVDSDMPIGKLKQITDFLPPPDQLVIPDDMTRVTLFLKKSSVHFFKREAGKYHTKYQRMIRQVVDRYAQRYQE